MSWVWQNSTSFNFHITNSDESAAVVSSSLSTAQRLYYSSHPELKPSEQGDEDFLKKLISENADYIIDDISQRLQFLGLFF